MLFTQRMRVNYRDRMKVDVYSPLDRLEFVDTICEIEVSVLLFL